MLQPVGLVPQVLVGVDGPDVVQALEDRLQDGHGVLLPRSGAGNRGRSGSLTGRCAPWVAHSVRGVILRT